MDRWIGPWIQSLTDEALTRVRETMKMEAWRRLGSRHVPASEVFIHDEVVSYTGGVEYLRGGAVSGQEWTSDKAKATLYEQHTAEHLERKFPGSKAESVSVGSRFFVTRRVCAFDTETVSPTGRLTPSPQPSIQNIRPPVKWSHRYTMEELHDAMRVPCPIDTDAIARELRKLYEEAFRAGGYVTDHYTSRVAPWSEQLAVMAQPFGDSWSFKFIPHQKETPMSEMFRVKRADGMFLRDRGSWHGNNPMWCAHPNDAGTWYEDDAKTLALVFNGTKQRLGAKIYVFWDVKAGKRVDGPARDHAAAQHIAALTGHEVITVDLAKERSRAQETIWYVWRQGVMSWEYYAGDCVWSATWQTAKALTKAQAQEVASCFNGKVEDFTDSQMNDRAKLPQVNVVQRSEGKTANFGVTGPASAKEVEDAKIMSDLILVHRQLNPYGDTLFLDRVSIRLAEYRGEVKALETRISMVQPRVKDLEEENQRWVARVKELEGRLANARKAVGT